MQPEPNPTPEEPLAAAVAQVNLYPERRQKRQSVDTEATDTSKFLRLSETPETREREEADEVGRGVFRKARQTTLSVRHGSVDIRKGGTARKRLVNPVRRGDDRRLALRQCAAETKWLLPGLLATRPDVSNEAWRNAYDQVAPEMCPGLSPIKITVANCDSIDATLLMPLVTNKQGYKPVAILNMANDRIPGGGWEYGAMAQEEALCYRTSLAFTLQKKFYPIPDDYTIYSPTVLVIRENYRSDHQLSDLREPSKLPVVSVISCAAVCKPETRTDANGDLRYAVPSEMMLMLDKMRSILRTAIVNGHRQIVLGAFGCGAFGNPKQQVARLWRIILQEKEFSGGWWSDIIFAVLGEAGDSLDNYWAFHEQLHGVEVK